MRKSTFFTLMALTCGALAAVSPSCHGEHAADAPASRLAETVEECTLTIADGLAMLTQEAAPSPVPEPLDSMPGDGCEKLRVNPPAGVLAKVFNDSNYLHLEAARALGIEPLNDTFPERPLRHPLQRIVSTKDYYVTELRHSFPLLVPEAEALLSEIGRRFSDTLAARGGGAYRIKVTSVLRTPGTVKRLRRVNRAATDSSAHQYGTTFDISFTRYMLTDTVRPYRTQEDLKNLLAEILGDLRDHGRCYVKYERKQGCFHITARPTSK